MPDQINKNLMSVQDLISEMKNVSKISLTSKKASDYIKGPGIHDDLKKGELLNTKNLIDLAGPNNDGSISRLSAALILEYRVNTDDFLFDLYWLAITGLKDASREYLSAIYKTIYKAELARLNK